MSPHIVDFESLAEQIRASAPRCGPVRLVAIDGPGGAGKSVFAARLSDALDGAPVVHTDDFASWEHPHDWWDRFEELVLGPLERGEPARYQAYDWNARRYGAWLEIANSDIVIVEGVSSSRRKIIERLNLAVWIDTPPDARLARGIERDGEAMRPQWDAWMADEDAFFAADRTRDRADVIVDGAPALAHDPELEFVSIDR